MTMGSSIGRRIALSCVRRNARGAMKWLGFALGVANQAYKGGRYPVLEIAIWDALDCRAGWSRSGPLSWTYKSGETVEPNEGEPISGAFLSMLVVELYPMIRGSRWREELLEALIDEWKHHLLSVGMPKEQLEDMIEMNWEVTYYRSLFSD